MPTLVASLALPVATTAPRSLCAGDAIPEVIVKVVPEELSDIGCPKGSGDPEGPSHSVKAGEHLRNKERQVSQFAGLRAREGSLQDV